MVNVECGKTRSKKWPVRRCRRCMFMFHLGQGAWACATANCVNYDMSRRSFAKEVQVLEFDVAMDSNF